MIVESTMWIVNFMANSPIGTYFVYKRDLWASILSIYIFCHLFVRERKQFWSFWYFSYLVFATVICFDLFSWKSFWINHEWNANWRWPCMKWRLPSFLFYLISSALKHIKGERSMHFVHRIIGFRILQIHNVQSLFSAMLHLCLECINSRGLIEFSLSPGGTGKFCLFLSLHSNFCWMSKNAYILHCCK